MNALNVLYAQLTCDVFAIAKFLFCTTLATIAFSARRYIVIVNFIVYCLYGTVDQAACFTILDREHNKLQDAQLSQRDRAMLHIIEYFAKSLKITQGHSK